MEISSEAHICNFKRSVAEWLKAAVLKTVRKKFREGWNPSASEFKRIASALMIARGIIHMIADVKFYRENFEAIDGIDKTIESCLPIPRGTRRENSGGHKK